MTVLSISRMTIASILLLVMSVGMAQTTVYPPNPQAPVVNLDHIYPYRGTYYDPHQAGTGIQVDVGANGSAFVTLYSYTATGQPNWYILQSTYQPSDEVTRWTTGVIGTMSGPFYQAFNGQCLGCPYTPTGGAVVAPFPQATLSWVNSREIKMTVGDQHWDFIAPNLDGKSDGDYLIGTWVIHILQWYSGYPVIGGPFPGPTLVDGYATFNIAPDPAGNNITIAPGSAAGLTPLAPSFKVYSLSCAEVNHATSQPSKLCPAIMVYPTLYLSNHGGAFEFWFDPATGRLGADVVSSSRQVGPMNEHVDLYIENPDLIIGRGISEGTGFPTKEVYQGLLQDGYMNIEFIMHRVPDGFVGGNTNYGPP